MCAHIVEIPVPSQCKFSMSYRNWDYQLCFHRRICVKAAEAAVNISVPAAAAAVGESISSNLITDRRDILLRINTKEKIVYIKLSYKLL